MFKVRKIKIFLTFNLVILISLSILSSSMTAGPIDSFSEVKGKLADISEVEKNVISTLFILVQETEEMERQEAGIKKEIETISREVESLEKKIADGQADYKKKKDIVKQVLSSYQRTGPGSYLEIILNSENLTGFLRNISILRDFTRSTKELLQSLEENAKQLSSQKTALNEKLVIMKDKQEKLASALEKKLQLKEEREKYLASLQSERKYYQEHLSNIQKVWGELKLLFADTASEFSRILEEGDLPWDDLKITYSFSKVTGSIDEKAFNNILRSYSRIPEMEVKFHKDSIEIEMPKKNLTLKGAFVIKDGQILRFKADEGSFYGMPLESSAIAELFREGYLEMNLKNVLIGRSYVESVNVTEGNLELDIIPALF